MERACKYNGTEPGCSKTKIDEKNDAEASDARRISWCDESDTTNTNVRNNSLTANQYRRIKGSHDGICKKKIEILGEDTPLPLRTSTCWYDTNKKVLVSLSPSLSLSCLSFLHNGRLVVKELRHCFGRGRDGAHADIGSA